MLSRTVEGRALCGLLIHGIAIGWYVITVSNIRTEITNLVALLKTREPLMLQCNIFLA